MTTGGVCTNPVVPDGRIKAADSPRWCGYCGSYGDHHSDRCPYVPVEHRVGIWRDPGKPTGERHDWWDVALYGIVAIACVALAIWLATRHVDPCPSGWHERTLPHATVCTNPRAR